MDEYTFQVRDHSGKSFTVPVGKLPFWIGRGTENDLVLNEPSVSKRHACLARGPDGVTVLDNDSRNGVFFNDEGQRVLKSRSVNPGDVLRIGLARLKLQRADSLEIPLQARGPETLTFVPGKKGWDPIHQITAELDHWPAAGVEKSRGVSWRKLLSRLLIETEAAPLYELVFDVIEEIAPFDRCYVLTCDKDDLDRVTIAARRQTEGNQGAPADVFVSRHVLKQVLKSGEAVIVTLEDASIHQAQSFIRSGAQSAACIPLVVRRRVTGVLYLDRVASQRPFSQSEIEDLGPFASIIALKLENLQLLREQVAAEVVKRDLETARNIQESLLPQELAVVPGYSIEGFSAPCYQVGGDYYDVIHRQDGTVTILVGDVSGKGLASAIYMACARSVIHAYIGDGLPLERLMARLSQHTRSTFRSDHFLTLFAASLELKTGTLTYCNAGHEPPIIVSAAGEASELDATAPALNIIDWNEFACCQIQLAPGDLLLLHTDGIVEAEAPGGEQFGKDRLLKCLRHGRDGDLRRLRQAILEATRTFAAETGPHDDQTLVLVRREIGFEGGGAGDTGKYRGGDGRGA